MKRQAPSSGDSDTDVEEKKTPVEKFTDCGGTLTGATGHFYTPYFPYTYPNNSDCVWTIEVGVVTYPPKLQGKNLNWNSAVCCSKIRYVPQILHY